MADAAVRKSLLADHSIEIGGGLGKFAGKVWRIGLMGENARVANVLTVLAALGQVLEKHGFKPRTGAAVEAARAFGP